MTKTKPCPARVQSFDRHVNTSHSYSPEDKDKTSAMWLQDSLSWKFPKQEELLEIIQFCVFSDYREKKTEAQEAK